jgi:hypothetical protein
MRVIETEEDLFRDLFDKVPGDALVVMWFNETMQVFAMQTWRNLEPL